MGAKTSISLPKEVAPDETIDISVDLAAPTIPGNYKGIWSFEDGKGQRFGLGISSTGEIWVQVEVAAPPTATPTVASTPTQAGTPTATNTPTPVPPFVVNASETLAYDFAAQVCAGQWLGVNGALPCSGSGGEALGIVTMPTLEDGSTMNYPAIALKPGGANGFVTGVYPEYEVQSGDHFRALASCEADAKTCSVLFRFSYQDASGTITDLWAVGEFYDRNYTKIDIDLSPLAGQKVKFILDVTSLNSDPNVRVLWAAPGIYRLPLPTSTPTFVPTVTSTSTPTLAPTATATVTPVPSATPVPQPAAQPSAWEKFQQFISDLFKKLFGG